MHYFMFLLFFLFPAFPALAAPWAGAKDIVFCPAPDDAAPAPDFNGPDCQSVRIDQLDPQHRQIWVRARLEAPPELLDRHSPAGLYVMGKAASEVWLNGVRLGANGAPSAIAEREQVGRMDAVFFTPPNLLKATDNELVVRMSAHHGFLRFAYPIHVLALGVYENPTTMLLKHYWPSLIPFGVLAAAAVYFLASAFSGGLRVRILLLAAMAVFAAGQLYIEVYRALVAYPYTFHEWRMLLVALCSLGFGMSLAAYTVMTFNRKRAVHLLAGVLVISIGAGLIAPGYDTKAGLMVLIPALFSAAVAAWAAWRRLPQSRLHFAAISIFVLSIFLKPLQFLDWLFFYEVAALMIVMFAAQAFALSEERRLRLFEQERARQLELSLERASHEDPKSLRIASAGRIEMAPIDDITHCKSAGDYVEIFFNDSRTILHNSSMAKLEDDLPANFLRVHRSWLVNTNYIQSLNREQDGAGELMLITGQSVPVSRRILPNVRSRLQ